MRDDVANLRAAQYDESNWMKYLKQLDAEDGA